MASFSDDESFAVDQILDQRKRKGIVEYLVQWKGESDKDPAASTWEPAESIAADCTKAVKSFLKSKSKKRSLSKSRKSSRSRSRSVSRGRKAADKVTPTRRSTRSSSRGRATKIPVSEKKAAQLKASEEPTEIVKEVEVTKQTEASSSTVFASVSQTTTTIKQSESMSEEKKTEVQSEGPGRVLRSSTMATREKLEVQRVHNEQRPMHKDDDKPRSAIWKVADYVVIVMFALSVVAALFLFLEKFIDLENFKRQAFPNVDILRSRLTDAVYSVFELLQGGVNKVSGLWLNLIDQIGSGSGKK